MIKRTIDLAEISKLIKFFSSVAILGPRQCGKTTLAKSLKSNYYFDLENPRDLAKLDNPQLALENLYGLIVIDEIQRKPQLFELLRYLMVRILQPWHVNVSKRLVKSPKIYIRDSGIFHSLMSIDNMEQLMSHNKLWASWEGFALELVIQCNNKTDTEIFFWSTHTGAEIDLFWQDKGKNWGCEFKFADAPKITKSMKIAIQDLNLEHLWIVYPGKEKYKLSNKITALPIKEITAANNPFI